MSRASQKQYIYKYNYNTGDPTSKMLSDILYYTLYNNNCISVRWIRIAKRKDNYVESNIYHGKYIKCIPVCVVK